MTISTIDHNEAFARFWRTEFNSMKCPPVPAKPDELGLTVQMALQSYQGGALYQNLFGSKGSAKLPADVSVRRNAAQSIPQDADGLRQAGLEYEAQQAELRRQQLQDQELALKAEQGRKQFLEQKKAYEQWSNASLSERMVMAPPTPESIARAREEWGITGRANWEK